MPLSARALAPTMASSSGPVPAARRRVRVVYWLNQPTPYFVARFNAVADRCELDFEAWFNEVRQADRSWEVDESGWRFRARYILPGRPSCRLGRLGQLRLPIAELSDAAPDLVVQEYDRPLFAAGFLAARAHATRTAFRVLPNYDTWSQRTWWRELSKHFLFRAVDGAKVPGLDGAALARRYGLSADRIQTVTQSVDVPHYQGASSVPAQERAGMRERLGLRGCVFAYVGRLWWGKGLEDLLEAYERLRARRSDVSLLVIGDGVHEARYRNRAAALAGVVFTGFIQPAQLPRAYALADVVVFPTLGDPNGLVVEEAMAAGLPVVATSAAGDIQRRLPEGRAGYIVPPADPAALADRMDRLAADPAARARMARTAQALAAERSDERYALEFEQFVAAIMALPGRRTAAAWLARTLGHGVLLLGAHRAPTPLASLGPRPDASAASR